MEADKTVVPVIPPSGYVFVRIGDLMAKTDVNRVEICVVAENGQTKEKGFSPEYRYTIGWISSSGDFYSSGVRPFDWIMDGDSRERTEALRKLIYLVNTVQGLKD